ncbi:MULTISPECIES: hypothetical protein [Pseudomonas]|nr:MULTISPECIES: hypothetical protein [Pseudomonas]AHF66954.1 hypothetical protein PCH70_18010 [Pseudomonas cichorii JBC1]QVE18846.1 hypothetical protein KGD89_09005 [Pseudomonas cichorii]SDN44440.1 hypothetical protein SAMN05216599_1026 [Pseudomonas cichorii]GFM74186.1 hypothetical protein PSCICM_00050 [Pseudomonas cichorii]GFM91397.1 hypothetical protein PSCICP_13690 [Pseudomonas cichorii]
MPLIPAFDALQIQHLANDIDAQGFTTLTNILSDTDLEQLRAFTDSQASKHPGEYFAYHGEKSLGESLLASLWSDPTFKQLMASLYRHAALQESPSEQIFPVLRCIQGSQGVRESNCFHFDASLVTALIPIYIPVDGEECGDLMLFTNARKLRNNVARNVVEKALLQNRFSRWLTCAAINRGWLRPTVLKLQPGNIYLFWGYRSLHANQPCSPGLKRATAILHFGDPHSGSTLTRLILGMNQGRAARVSAQTSSSPPEPTSP